MKKHLILDLDGTLFFADHPPGAIAIKGRRRDSYIADETVQLLRKIQASYNIILATGRSISSIRLIFSLMKANGVNIKGIVAENGGLYLQENQVKYLVSRAWMQKIEEIHHHMGGKVVQADFATCLALLRPTDANIDHALDLCSLTAADINVWRDGNKVFFLLHHVNKRYGLECLLGHEQLSMAAGIGNDINDLEWLQAVKKPAAPACANEQILDTVTARRGIISQNTGHDGIAELLSRLINEQ